MPSLKSDIYITITADGKTFRIGGVRLPNNRYAIKRGRSWAQKKPTATLSEIFSAARKWAVEQSKT
jgi:hypothetical protein